MNLAAVLQFQPLHCDLLGFLRHFCSERAYDCCSQVRINTAVSVNNCVYILTHMSKKLHTQTTRTLHVIYWLRIFNRYCTMSLCDRQSSKSILWPRMPKQKWQTLSAIKSHTPTLNTDVLRMSYSSSSDCLRAAMS